MPIRREQGGRAVGLVIAMAAMLSGCDYWPPALQTQIEQLRSELQNVTLEKAQLQNQMASFNKVKEDLQAQVNDLTKANREKATMITSLQNGLTAAQERLAKTAKTSAAKPATKVTQKAPTKKKAPAKATVKR